MNRPARIAILVGPKSQGSNMMALVHSCREDKSLAEVALVIAPSTSAPAYCNAKMLGVSLEVVSPERPDDYGTRLVETLTGHQIDFVCLAGYIRMLPSEVLLSFQNKVLNIHPALLPKFGGKGMYGIRVHQAVIRAGEKESGCTVHYVTTEYDEGEIILQLRCPVLPSDTPKSLAKRVLALEHEAYPAALRIAIERSSQRINQA